MRKRGEMLRRKEELAWCGERDTTGVGRWFQRPELPAIDRAEAEVSEAIDKGDAQSFAEALAELRTAAGRAARRLSLLIDGEGRKLSPFVQLAASRAVLALAEKAEKRDRLDRLAAVEAALRAEGKLPPLPDTDTTPPAQTAPGADGADKG